MAGARQQRTDQEFRRLDPSAVELLDGGRAAFSRMLAAIEEARQHVHLEMYAFELDMVGNQFLRALIAAAKRGVRVQVVVDGWGSLRCGAIVVAKLRAAGCEAEIHNRVSQMLLGRIGCNHRKLLMVDDHVVFIGGINIGESFAAWDDLAVEIRSPACGALVEGLNEPRSAPVHRRIRILLSRFRAGMRLRREYLDAIANARDRVLIAHSYFLPDRSILRAIRAARHRGAEVILLLPHRSDVPLARIGTRRLYRRLLGAGVRIYELRDRILHAKATVVDGSVTLIGSFNLDPLSLTNLEALVRLEDKGLARQVERWIESRLGSSIRIATVSDTPPGSLQDWLLDTLGLWVRRTAFWLARWIAKRHGRHGDCDLETLFK